MLSASLVFATLPGPIIAATSASAGMSFAGIATVIFAATFVGYFVYVGVREWRAIRRERQPVHAGDPHTVHLADLGPSMADGGEPEPGPERDEPSQR